MVSCMKYGELEDKICFIWYWLKTFYTLMSWISQSNNNHIANAVALSWTGVVILDITMHAGDLSNPVEFKLIHSKIGKHLRKNES